MKESPPHPGEKYHRVVESIIVGIAFRPQSNQYNLTAQDAEDMKKIVEQVLEQMKLVTIEKELDGMKISFTTKIMEKPLPPKFKLPQINFYLGKIDPHDHIQNYEFAMMLHDWKDAIMCQVFSLTLADQARI